MQADTGKTPENAPTRAIVTRSPGQHVSSKFIRREAARAAGDGRYAKTEATRFSILRTRVLHEMRKHKWRRLAVVPLTPGAGGTFVAVNLAVAMARQKHTDVILIDLDLARPSVADRLGIPGCDGMAETLRQKRSFTNLISIVEEAPNLSVVAVEHPEAEASEILQDADFAASLRGISEQAPDAIQIIDSAALLSGDSALAALPLVDAILLVADGRKGTATAMTEATRLLRDMPPVMGVVLNKSDD